MTSTVSGQNWQRTSPIAVVFFFMRAVRQFVTNGLPAIAVVLTLYAKAGESNQQLIVFGLLLLIILSAIGAVLAWLRFGFCIIDERILVRSGILHREELSVEFGRIQNISIREPVYMRPFGLALLSIDTAGSSKKEIVLGGIKNSVAVSLRETILLVTRAMEDCGESQDDKHADPSLLLSRSGKDIVIYGLTINFLVWFVVAIGALFGAHDVTENIVEWLTTNTWLKDLIIIAQNEGGVITISLIMLGLGFVMLFLLPLISVIGALFRHYGYRLSIEGETYRKNSGLLSRHDESLKRHKIQSVVLRQNFVARLFNRTNVNLRVASAGSGVEHGHLPTARVSTFLVPVLHPEELTTLISEFLPACELNQAVFSRINLRRFVTVFMGFAVLPPALLVTSIFTIFVSWKFFLILPLASVIAWLVLYRLWQKTGYALVGEYGFVRNGFVGTNTTIFPLFKVQRVDFSQTPGQRRRGLAHLTIHLASHSLKIPYMTSTDAKAMRDLLLFKVESTNRPWY